MEEVEKLLMVWINEKHLADGNVSEALICEKARLLYSDITRVLVLKNLRLVKGGLKIVKREQGFTV